MVNDMDNNNKEKNKKIQHIIVIIILIILLITSIIGSSKLGKVDILIPTGNVDIFDINICCDDKCNDKDDSGMVNGDASYDNTVTGTFGIIDSNIKWYDQAQLNIFNNYAFQMKNIIAPGVSNTYNFIVRNNNSFPIKYSFKTTEDNIYKVNMKYRLKQNGQYVIGDNNNWVTYDKISVSNAIVSSKSKTLYSLEWKWEDNENDNYAGEAIDAIYKLIINVNAEQYEI